MAAIRTFEKLLNSVRKDLKQRKTAQIASVSQVLTQLLILGLIYEGWGDKEDTRQEQSFKPKQIVIVLTSTKEMAVWLNFLEFLSDIAIGELPHFSSWGSLRYVNANHSINQRLKALSNLIFEKKLSVIVTTLAGLGQATLSQQVFKASTLTITVKDEVDLDQLISSFENLGYRSAQAVDDYGFFSVRGGIVDIWSPAAAHPVRIDFQADTIDSLRFFSSADQRSIGTLDSFQVTPIAEFLPSIENRKEQTQNLFNALLEQGIKVQDREGMLKAFQVSARFSGYELFLPILRAENNFGIDYLSDDAVVIFPSSKEECLRKYENFLNSANDSFLQDREHGLPTLEPSQHFKSLEKLDAELKNFATVEFGNPFSQKDTALYRFETGFSLEGAPPPTLLAADLFERWVRLIDELLAKHHGSVVILAHHDETLEKIKSLLNYREIRSVTHERVLQEIGLGRLEPGSVILGKGDLAAHLWLEERGILLIPDVALLGARPRKKKSISSKLQNYLSSFADLKLADLVVHVEYGIARYQGLTSMVLGGITADFLILEYAGGDKIYLPVDRLNLLQRYSTNTDQSSGDHALDKLGGQGWNLRKAKIKAAIEDVAERLLVNQARRQVSQGIRFAQTDTTFEQFVEQFPYEETEDQLRAIQDVEGDLSSGKPMDRLICGDVGFGKTEVALRAAMRSVLEGWQVIVLVPTTVLCFQHYRTFKERLGKFAVNVSQLNRFVKLKDAKKILNSFQSGEIDILVGTHSLLGKKVKPKKLGLIIVDEEQRFGVGHKEKLKELSSGSHLLTLSATPIPRTLHMAMIGLRDISIIATPPHDRLSIRTYIAVFDENLIKEAISHEVARGGQVFFVHNRIEDIHEIQAVLHRILPHIRVRVGHGQMHEDELEQVIIDFIEQKFDVLLCTSIIESGVDMPNVNLLIVNRADRFGLSQLYQLRGRVGRSSIQAHAYFLTPHTGQLTEDAKERLTLLAAYQDLGSGFQIASHDLEMRGAGNLLGSDQSGYASAIGLELYTELLEAAIRKIQGQIVEEKIDTEIKLPISSLIPKDFVRNENYRLATYKKIFGSETEEQLSMIRSELKDRFGELPEEVKLLFHVAKLKQMLAAISCSKITELKGQSELRFGRMSEDYRVFLQSATSQRPDVYRLKDDGRLFINHGVLPVDGKAFQEKLVSSLIDLVVPLVPH